MPVTMKEMEAAAWAQLRQSLVNSINVLVTAESKKHPDLPEQSHREIKLKLVKVMELTLTRMEGELGNLPQKLLGNPDEALADFAQLFIKHFRPVATELYCRDEDGRQSKSFLVAIESSITETEELVRNITKPSRMISEAIEKGEYDRAEAIIRGKLAMDTDDVGAINQLLTIACFTGKIGLFVEALNMAESRSRLQITPEVIEQDYIGKLLQGAVVENIVVGTNSLTQPDLLVEPRTLSASQRREIQEMMLSLMTAVIKEIISKITTEQRWTTDRFLAMCKGAIAEKCRTYEQWVPGTRFFIQWKGEELPSWMKQRIIPS